MKEKMYCYDCDCDIIPKVSYQKNEYVIHKESFIVDEKVYNCPNCNNEVFGNELNKSLNNIYNKYLNLYNLSIDEFKEIRLFFNLSQDSFAKALGWHKRSIIRYENGDSLPQKQHLLIYQKIKNNKIEFIKILNNNSSLLTKKEYYDIYQKIKADFDLKTINVLLYILNKNELYQTQLMKYLFAVDFKAMKDLKYPLTCLKYAKAPHGPIINDRKVLLNFLVSHDYINIIFDESDKVKFVSKKMYDDSLFTKEEKNIIEEIIVNFKGKSSAQLSLWSHKFKGWKNTIVGEIIDYEYASDFKL